MNVAESLNALRVIPRLLVLGYAYLMNTVAVWFMALADPTNAQAGFVSALILAGAGVFRFYVDSGNKGKKDD